MSTIVGQVKNTHVKLAGTVLQGGLRILTPAQFIEALPAVTAIDFTNFENGTFTETVNGKVIAHTVTFDDSGRPTAIDGVTITWGAV